MIQNIYLNFTMILNENAAKFLWHTPKNLPKVEEKPKKAVADFILNLPKQSNTMQNGNRNREWFSMHRRYQRDVGTLAYP